MKYRLFLRINKQKGHKKSVYTFRDTAPEKGGNEYEKDICIHNNAANDRRTTAN